MLNLSSNCSEVAAEKLEIARQKIEKHAINVIIIDRNAKNILICGEKIEVFRALNWFQNERVLIDLEVFITDLGKLIRFSFKDGYKGWREIFRLETAEKLMTNSRKITFCFNTQVKKVISPLGLHRSLDRHLILNEKEEIFARCVPRRTSCEISFLFSLKTVEYIKNIVFLPALVEINVERDPV